MKRISSLLGLAVFIPAYANSAAEGNRPGITPHASADVYIGNLGRELSLPAANLKLEASWQLWSSMLVKRSLMRSSWAKSGCLGGERADCDPGGTGASDIPYRHDRQLLHNALEKAYRL